MNPYNYNPNTGSFHGQNPNTYYPQQGWNGQGQPQGGQQFYPYPPQQYPQAGMNPGYSSNQVPPQYPSGPYMQPQNNPYGGQNPNYYTQSQSQPYYPQPGMNSGYPYGQPQVQNPWGSGQGCGNFNQVQQVNNPGVTGYTHNFPQLQYSAPSFVPGLNSPYQQPQTNLGTAHPGYLNPNPQENNPYYNPSTYSPLTERASSQIPASNFSSTPVQQPIHSPISSHIESQLELDEDILESYIDRFNRIPDNLEYSELNEKINEFMDWTERQEFDDKTKEQYFEAFLEKIQTKESDRRVCSLLAGYKMDKLAIDDFIKYIKSEKDYLNDDDSKDKFEETIIHFASNQINKLKDEQEKISYIKQLAENCIYTEAADTVITNFLAANQAILNSPSSYELIGFLANDTSDKHDFILKTIKNAPEEYLGWCIQYISQSKHTDVSHISALIQLIKDHKSSEAADQIAYRLSRMDSSKIKAMSDDQLTQLYSQCENKYCKERILNLYTHRISTKKTQDPILLLDALLKQCEGYDLIIQEKLLELAKKEDNEKNIHPFKKTKEFAYLKQFLSHPNCNPEDYKYEIGSKEDLKNFILKEGLENWSPEKNEQFLPILNLNDPASISRYVNKPRELLAAAEDIKTQAQSVYKHNEEYKNNPENDPAQISACRQILELMKLLQKDETTISSITTCLKTIQDLLRVKYDERELRDILNGGSPTQSNVVGPLKKGVGGFEYSKNLEMQAEARKKYADMRDYEMGKFNPNTYEREGGVKSFLKEYNDVIYDLAQEYGRLDAEEQIAQLKIKN